MNIVWNAEKYTADFSLAARYGGGVTEPLELRPGGQFFHSIC